MPGHELMTVAETAKYLRVDESFLYGKSRFNEFPGLVRIGRWIRFDKEVIDQWLEDQLGDNGDGNG